MAKFSGPFVKVLRTPGNKALPDPGGSRSMIPFTTNPFHYCPPSHEPQDQDLNNLPETSRTMMNPSFVGVIDGSTNRDKISFPPLSQPGSCRFVSMEGSVNSNRSLDDKLQTPGSLSTEIPLSINPPKSLPKEHGAGNAWTLDSARLEKWNGLQFEYDMIENRFEIDWEHPLGSGSGGEVVKAQDRWTNQVMGVLVKKANEQEYAVKILYNLSDTKFELLALRTVTEDDNPNAHVIAVYDSWFHVNRREHSKRTMVKMQLCEGTLKDYLADLAKSERMTTPLEIVEIMFQILSGLDYVHKKCICHRDLKLSNILFIKDPCKCHSELCSKLRWLITDFGFAVHLGGDKIRLSSKARGTNTYRAPELLQYSQFSHKSDIWAIGCILFRVATANQKHPFLDDINASRYKVIVDTPTPKLTAQDNKTLDRIVGNMPFYEHLNDVIADCFNRDDQQRPTAEDLYKRFERLRNQLTEEHKTLSGPVLEPKIAPGHAAKAWLRKELVQEETSRAVPPRKRDVASGPISLQEGFLEDAAPVFATKKVNDASASVSQERRGKALAGEESISAAEPNISSSPFAEESDDTLFV